MSDRIFFPITFIVAILLVAAALAPVANRRPTGSVSFSAAEIQNAGRELVIEGEELYKFIAGGDADIAFVSDPGGQTVAVITAGAGMLADDPVKGPHFRLAADVENLFANQRIRVTVTAKPGTERGATAIAMNYSAGRLGESGWQTVNLTPDYSDTQFEYAVPPKETETENGVDFFAIRPVVPDKTRSVIIRRVKIERLGAVS